ncbi:topology modulation protein [Priestia endophytica]|uniref:topology modulation protein n=1 Tax=Priestia endophytica TaxID=135735 RepID=UPI000DCA6638|nr:topology modulation protein [Priestia endophytica]RAS83738.1 topology modulation protein [Priestia endophytica]
MNRIMVVGISPGVGKSTFARRLGEALHIEVHHLDALFWKPNWVEASLEEFSKSQQDIIPRDQWIIEGNYKNTFQIRLQRADTIIYLELPLHVCLYRVLKRFWMNRGKTRADLGEGCKEKLDWTFLKFICTTYYGRKKRMAEHFEAFQNLDPNHKVILLKSKKEIKRYLENLK